LVTVSRSHKEDRKRTTGIKVSFCGLREGCKEIEAKVAAGGRDGSIPDNQGST